MRLTVVLNAPPKFRFWKDFGAGRVRRMPYFKYWAHCWNFYIKRRPTQDYTLKPDQLPAGARIMNAEDFMTGNIDLLPAQILQKKDLRTLYDHPWPFNVKTDPKALQQPAHVYKLSTRLYMPKEDCQVLTNTILESCELQPEPPYEPSDKDLEAAQKQYDWSSKADSVLVGLPVRREWPKMNRKMRREYGISKERQEYNILNSIQDLALTLLAKHYHSINDEAKVSDLLSRRQVAFPRCNTPIGRADSKMYLQLFIDAMSVGSKPLPLVNPSPGDTARLEPVDIRPRTWRTLLEPTRQYDPLSAFSMPTNAMPHTLLLASRIKREYRNPDEMLARSMVHAFGVAVQSARLRAQGSPSGEQGALSQPIVIQTIGLQQPAGLFHFMRYQLNSTDFADSEPRRVKNQAWYSGPVGDLREALRYYLDFTSK